MRYKPLGSLIALILSANFGMSDPPRSPDYVPTYGFGAPVNTQAPPVFDKNCGPASCGLNPSCCFGQGGGHFWGSAEFLLWWVNGGNVPALATTGSPGSLGNLGAPGTTTLFGGDVDYRQRTGARFTLGAGLSCDCSSGVELGYFFLGGPRNRFDASSSGAADSPVLSRPFFNVITGLQDVQIVAFPGIASGNIQTSSSSRLQGADLNLFCNLCCRPACCATDCCQSGGTAYRVDIFGGPRWMQLNEDVVITEHVTDLATGTTFTIVDRFETRNNFYGGQVGARAELQRGRYFLSLMGKLALGATHQVVRISGTTVINEPGLAPNVQEGGLLALPTNMGTFSRDRFSVVPEIGVNVGYQVSEHIRIFAGYSFLYWSNVARPGDQIDVGINPTQLPTAAGPGTLVGPARPAFSFQDSGLWAHGINVGIQFQW
jgi:hypothetical protein